MISAITMIQAAKKLKITILSRMNCEFVKLKSRNNPDELKIAALNAAMDDIKNINRGAFLPIMQQPLIQGLAVLFGGGGGFLILESILIAG